MLTIFDMNQATYFFYCSVHTYLSFARPVNPVVPSLDACLSHNHVERSPAVVARVELGVVAGQSGRVVQRHVVLAAHAVRIGAVAAGHSLDQQVGTIHINQLNVEHQGRVGGDGARTNI